MADKKYGNAGCIIEDATGEYHYRMEFTYRPGNPNSVVIVTLSDDVNGQRLPLQFVNEQMMAVCQDRVRREAEATGLKASTLTDLEELGFIRKELAVTAPGQALKVTRELVRESEGILADRGRLMDSLRRVLDMPNGSSVDQLEAEATRVRANQLTGLGDLRKQLHAQEIEQARQEVLDAIGDVLDLPDLLTLEQLLKEVGDLRRERDRYENERDTVLKEVFGALGLTSRAYTDGSIESLLVELDKMTGERDGYKHAFERAASEVEGILREASSLYDRVSGLDTELERFDVE